MTFFDQIADTLIETMMYHSVLDYMEYYLSEITKTTMEKCEKCSKLVFYAKILQIYVFSLNLRILLNFPLEMVLQNFEMSKINI